jgi:aryl-alcohol dehydrogenase-like predicted oxidoreductase
VVTAPIIGASHPDQLTPSIAATDIALEGDLKGQLDALTHSYRLGDATR